MLAAFLACAAAAERPAPGAFPHELLGDALLGRVDAEGRVDYAALAADRAELDAYVDAVAAWSPASDPELFPTRQDQLAYYLNAHLALSVVAVLDHPHGRPIVGGHRMDPYRMVRDVITPSFHDPRVHAVLCDQTRSGAPMRDTPLHPGRLDEELDAAAERFVHDERYVRVDAEQVWLSRLFRWWAKDFRDAGGALAWIASVRGEPLPADPLVWWMPYDRSLIAQPGRAPPRRRRSTSPSRGSAARGVHRHRGAARRRRG
jgi:hypothetical protein